MNPWTLVYDDFVPGQEGLREALCTLGNGYFATRGAASERDADDIHYPGTYLAGGYNRLQTPMAGRTIENEDLVNLPNWLPLTFRVEGGDWFNVLAVDRLSFRQELDLKAGVLTRAVRFRDREGRVSRITERRLVHMDLPHLAAIELRLVAENWSGRVEFQAALDGRVVNAGVARYRSLNGTHLEPLVSRVVADDTIFLKVRTVQSDLRVAEAARTRAFKQGAETPCARRNRQERGFVAQRFDIDLVEGEEVAIEKVVALFTSRDPAVAECGDDAQRAVARAPSFEVLLGDHTRTWAHLWRRFDLQVEAPAANENNDRMSMILRLHLFHLLQTVSLHTTDDDVGVPARGWHGEAYRGHIFWDELFIFPLLNLRLPKITRALLLYRYRRINQARSAAAAAGLRGAMFPWQSGSTGREETQEVHLNPRSGRWLPDNSRLQRHVGSAIAYNTWRYYEATRDTEFLASYGAEMILEIARFWASIATYNAEIDRYEICGVLGPDEYHDGYPGVSSAGLDNNAYTNVMAVWVMCRALDALEHLAEDRRAELCDYLALSDSEVARWDEISRKMRIVFHHDGVISQFEGYEELEEFDWDGYRRKYGDIHRLDRLLEAEGDTPNRYKASKQADVLMLFYLFSAEELTQLFERLGYSFDTATIPRTVDYYVRRTSHGSTLSRVVHAWVLGRSDREGSWHLFTEALESDVADIQGGTTAEGIHLGAMAGTVDFIQRGATGIETRDDVLWFNPCLPGDLSRLRMQLRYRHHSLDVEVTHDALTVEARRSVEPEIHIGIGGTVHALRAGERHVFPLSRAACVGGESHSPNGPS